MRDRRVCRFLEAPFANPNDRERSSRPSARFEANLYKTTKKTKTSHEDSGSVRCDVQRLGQLASNLLRNAITYGAADRPVQLDASTDDKIFELFVANAGPPIPSRVMERIFQPFVRGVLGPNRQGLRLGLYISDEIARAHGRTLAVVSTEDETRFTFRMPISSPLD
ncbi:MAG: hypothetical protein C5B58_00325 [Acidobacteria bacterium]|nr:MAG: hypothetical protein C5B58_00325 [Acidobacteriota bacterium]